MIILGPKTPILGPQICRILVLGPQFWWSGRPEPLAPLDSPLIKDTYISTGSQLSIHIYIELIDLTEWTKSFDTEYSPWSSINFNWK